MKWKLYWASLGALVIGAAGWHNLRKYPTQSKSWLAAKTLADAGLSALLCAFAPVLAVTLGTVALMRRVKRDPLWQAVGGFAVASALSLCAAYLLEVLLVVGVRAADVITERIFVEARPGVVGTYEVDLAEKDGKAC